jgi:hypothetical protein
MGFGGGRHFQSAGRGGSVKKVESFGFSTSAFPSRFSAEGSWSGDVIRFSGTTIVVGKCYYLKSDGAWTLTSAATPLGEKRLIGLAVGTSSLTDGILINGFMRLNSGSYNGTATVGNPLYLSTTTGQLTFTKPTTSGYVVRVVGYCLVKDGSNNILINFNPDKTWVVLS